jgi:hypothetical protein
MKSLLTLAIAATALLTACQVDWQKAGTAAATAAAPIVLDGLNNPAAKQPRNVQP